jgi:hypothetical protein
MRNLVFLVLFAVLFSAVSAQTREQAISEINNLRQKVISLEKIALSPDKADFEAALKENAQVFRLMPREKYDKDVFTIRGGGAYYSFTRKAHEYGYGSDIELQQGNLSVGFAGADYGFIYNLSEMSLADVTKETNAVVFLAGYKPPTAMPEVRAEQRKARNYEAEGIVYKESVPAVVGKTYVLRSINFDESDVLVAFKVLRKDTDGSLIIFWKLIEQFEKPIIDRSDEAAQKQSGDELQQKVLDALRNKGFYNVTVDVSTMPMTLRGTVPKGKLAEAMMTVMESNGGKPVKNETYEQ